MERPLSHYLATTSSCYRNRSVLLGIKESIIAFHHLRTNSRSAASNCLNSIQDIEAAKKGVRHNLYIMSFSKLTQSLRRKRSTESTEVELLDVGDEAPDFELRDDDGNIHKLSSFRGRRVILSFFRYAS